MSLLNVLLIIRGRKKLFFGIVFTVVAAVALVSLLSPREYTAELALVADFKGSDPLSESTLAPQLLPTYLATQAEIIRSRNVALRVIKTLGLADDPEIVERFGEGEQAQIRLASALLERVEALASRNSNILRIAYTDTDPERAARIANAFGDAYVQASLELRVDPARRSAAWFGQQVEQLRKEYMAAQAKLAEYQKKHGVLGVDDARLDVENARLQELSTQLVNAQNAMYDAETRAAEYERGARKQGESPDLQKNPLLQNLRADLARAEAKLAELSARYDRNHPQYRSALAEVNALRSKLAAESNLAKGSLDRAAEIARRHVDEVQAALEEQKERIIALKRERDAMSVLSRDVESARAAYDEALAQATRTRLESRLDNINVAVLNPASPPMWPSSPRVLLNLCIALVVGVALALGVILTLELHSRRVRSHEDLLEFAGLAVLAELPPLPDLRKKGRPRLPPPRLQLEPKRV
jgi:chain length determinant protein EpsF